MSDRAADEFALRELAARYATGADNGDVPMFTGVFMPDATLKVFRALDAKEPATHMVGHEQLAGIPPRLKSRYNLTFHILGQCLYEIGTTESTGLVYCLAHHLSVTHHGGTNYVMHMRYSDKYRRDGQGAWKIAERVAHVSWTDTRVANAVGT